MDEARQIVSELEMLMRATSVRSKALALLKTETSADTLHYRAKQTLRANDLLLRRGYLQVYLGENDVAAAQFMQTITEFYEFTEAVKRKIGNDQGIPEALQAVKNAPGNFVECCAPGWAGEFFCALDDRQTEYEAAVIGLYECERLGTEMRELLDDYNAQLANRGDNGQYLAVNELAREFLANNKGNGDYELANFMAFVAVGSGPVYYFAINESMVDNIRRAYLESGQALSADFYADSSLASVFEACCGSPASQPESVDFYRLEEYLTRFDADYYIEVLKAAAQRYNVEECYVHPRLFNMMYGNAKTTPASALLQNQTAAVTTAHSVFTTQAFRLGNLTSAYNEPQTCNFTLKVLQTVRSTDREYIQHLFGLLQCPAAVVHFYKTSFAPGTLRLSNDFSSMFLKTYQMRECYSLGKFTGFGTNFYAGMDRKKSILACFGASGSLCLYFSQQSTCDTWVTGIKYIVRVWKQMPAIRGLLGALRGKDSEG